MQKPTPRPNATLSAILRPTLSPLERTQHAILAALPENVYRGTVPASTIARNRAANKAARKARRANR